LHRKCGDYLRSYTASYRRRPATFTKTAVSPSRASASPDACSVTRCDAAVQTNHIPVKQAERIHHCTFLLRRRTVLSVLWCKRIQPLRDHLTTVNVLYSLFWVIPRPLFHLHRFLHLRRRQSVPKRRHIKFRSRGITQKKEYNFQTVKV
jgi:hypothetical protein